MGALQNQLTMAWNNLAVEFRIHIPEPTSSTLVRNFIEQIDAQADMWMELARRPTTSSQQDEYANRPFVPRSQGKQPLLLETEKGSPSRPTQKPSTDNKDTNEKSEEDQEMVPDPDGYYLEDPDLDYHEEENTPTALAISPVQACRRCQAEFQSNNLLHKHLRAGGYLPKPTANTLPTAFHRGVEIITNLGTGFGFRNRTMALPISMRGIG